MNPSSTQLKNEKYGSYSQDIEHQIWWWALYYHVSWLIRTPQYKFHHAYFSDICFSCIKPTLMNLNPCIVRFPLSTATHTYVLLPVTPVGCWGTFDVVQSHSTTWAHGGWMDSMGGESAGWAPLGHLKVTGKKSDTSNFSPCCIASFAHFISTNEMYLLIFVGLMNWLIPKV